MDPSLHTSRARQHTSTVFNKTHSKTTYTKSCMHDIRDE